MSEQPKKMYEIVAEKIIEQLKAGTAPWQKPWTPANANSETAYNAVTGKPYRGLNAVYLTMFSPFEDPRFATFKQAKEKGWEVKKGAKGMIVNYVKTISRIKKLNEKGKPILDENGKPIMVNIYLDRPIITSAWVFNAEQIKGIPPLPIKEVTAEKTWETIQRAEKIIESSGAEIKHVTGDRAYYSPGNDKICMPDQKQFDSAQRYYATLLHELGHWTGHETRLDRDLTGGFGSQNYAKEELRAEIASMMIGNELNIGHDPGQHMAYVDSWVKILTDTPYEIHSACADAQRIADYVIAFENQNKIVKHLKEEEDKSQSMENQTINKKENNLPNNKRFKVDRNYTHFAVRKSDNKIVDGWDYKGLEKDEIKHWTKLDFIDRELSPKDYKVIEKKAFAKLMMDPMDWNNWVNDSKNEIETNSGKQFNVADAAKKISEELNSADNNKTKLGKSISL